MCVIFCFIGMVKREQAPVLCSAGPRSRARGQGDGFAVWRGGHCAGNGAWGAAVPTGSRQLAHGRTDLQDSAWGTSGPPGGGDSGLRSSPGRPTRANSHKQPAPQGTLGPRAPGPLCRVLKRRSGLLT